MNDADDSLENIGLEYEGTETSESSPPMNTGGQLSLWGGHPASRSVVPGSEEAREMTAISGRKLLPLLKSSSPVGACLRTLLESSRWGSMEYALTWKARATKSGRLFFLLAPSTPRRSGQECGSWLAPRETMIDESQEAFASRMNSKRKNDRKDGFPNILCQVKATWPTPRKTDEKMGHNAISTGTQNNHQLVKATWHTPESHERTHSPRDCGHGTVPLANQITGANTSWCLARTGSFVERLITLSAWLMGYSMEYLSKWDRAVKQRGRRRPHKKSAPQDLTLDQAGLGRVEPEDTFLK